MQQDKIPFQYEAYQQRVDEMTPTFTPAYMHGLIWAMLVSFGEEPLTAVPFFQKLSEDELALFDQLYADSLSQMQDVGIVISLLLPLDETPLSYRLEALSDWCEGFLEGIQIAEATGSDLTLSQNSLDIVKDIESISSLNADEVSTEENEKYYLELVEFLRVAVLLLAETQDEPTEVQTEEARILH